MTARILSRTVALAEVRNTRRSSLGRTGKMS
jgi:hypothetical protein